MTVLRIKDPVTGDWIDIPAIVGPPGPPGEVTEGELDELRTVVYSDFYPPVGSEYYTKTPYVFGSISSTGANVTNSARLRTNDYFSVDVAALEVPVAGWQIQFSWYASASVDSFLQQDAEFQACGPGVLNRVTPPDGAAVFRCVLKKADGTSPTSANITELKTATLFYGVYWQQAEEVEREDRMRHVYNRQLAIKAGSVSFDFENGYISATGAKAADSAYMRTAAITLSYSSFVLQVPDGYVLSSVAFFTSTTVGTSTFVSRRMLRYADERYLLEMPETAKAFVASLHRSDYAAIGDEDRTALASGLKLFVSTDRSYGPITQSDARAAFVSYMNRMCTKLGLSGTSYTNASGLNRDNVSCPADELKLAVAVAGNPLASDIWSTKDRDFAIGGTNPRTVSVQNNVYSAEPTGALYKLLGGKGGTLTDTNYYRKARMGIYDVNGTAVAVALMGPGQWISSNMPECTQELLGMMATELSGGTPSEGSKITSLISNGGGYAAVPVPGTACAYLNSCTPAELLQRQHALHSSESAAQTPASTTKTMTMLCALSVAADLQEVITLVSDDVSSGSGSTFAAGDKLTLEEALRIMMMESSNTMAEAAGRVIGEKLLRAAEAKV